MAVECRWEAFLLGKRVKWGSHSSSCMLEIKEDLTSLRVHILVHPYLETLYSVYCREFDLFIWVDETFLCLDVYLDHWNKLWHLEHSPVLKGVQNKKDSSTNLVHIIRNIKVPGESDPSGIVHEKAYYYYFNFNYYFTKIYFLKRREQNVRM